MDYLYIITEAWKDLLDRISVDLFDEDCLEMSRNEVAEIIADIWAGTTEDYELVDWYRNLTDTKKTEAKMIAFPDEIYSA